MGIVPPPRALTTNSMDTTNGGSISFAFTMADDDDNAPCEGPDRDQEAIFLQYSTNGSVWTTITTFYEGWATPGADIFVNNWKKYYFSIPTAAQSATTKFRWFQSCVTSNSTDHWGLDEIVIAIKKPTTITITNLTAGGTVVGSSTSSPYTLSVSPTITTTYRATITDGVTLF